MTHPESKTHGPAGHEQTKDPVCGMTVAADSPHQIERTGRKYVFCSAGCLEKFRKEPERYTA
ncbi:MAG: YHS domain-containing protein [Deltaproteobacteria bacterium]|nr:YHS domain-containing protein [Deltaproteobacteria bacterium]